MQDLLRRALDTAAQQGAEYADARIVRRRSENVTVKSARVEAVRIGETEGIGVRVLVSGAWGFASTARVDGPEVDRIAGLAVRIARASARSIRQPVVLDDRPPARGRYETPVREDPFSVPMDGTGDLLLAGA